MNMETVKPSQLNDRSQINWAKIIKLTLIVVVVLGISKVLLQLFVAAGPLFKGMEDVLGAGANLVEGLTNGCSVQPDCKKTTDATVCKNQDNCGWNSPESAEEEPTCVNMTGRKSGSGGFFSTSCGLGIGAILYACGLLFSGIVTLLAAGFSTNKNVETTGRLNGKGTADTLEDVVKETKKGVQEIDNESTEPLADEQIRLISATASNSVSTNKLLDIVRDQEADQKIAEQAISDHAAIDAAIIKDAQENGMSDDDIRDSQEKVDDKFEPVEFKAVNVLMLFNTPPSQSSVQWIYSKMNQRPSLFESHHINFILNHL